MVTSVKEKQETEQTAQVLTCPNCGHTGTDVVKRLKHVGGQGDDIEASSSIGSSNRLPQRTISVTRPVVRVGGFGDGEGCRLCHLRRGHTQRQACQQRGDEKQMQPFGKSMSPVVHGNLPPLFMENNYPAATAIKPYNYPHGGQELKMIEIE